MKRALREGKIWLAVKDGRILQYTLMRFLVILYTCPEFHYLLFAFLIEVHAIFVGVMRNSAEDIKYLLIDAVK